MEGSVNERLDFGKMGYGCQHYRRRCRIRAPCCNEVYSCRHCHNESTSMERRFADRHELDRHEVKQVICQVCDTEQPVAKVCTNCVVKMGEYFCEICKFYDDDKKSSFTVTIVGFAGLAYLFYVRAWMKMSKGRFDEALTYADKAGEIDPYNVEVCCIAETPAC